MPTLEEHNAYSEYLRSASPNRTAAGELHTEEMVLNMGPQHPSTHGVLRLELVTDGELVVDVIPHLGYMHRCFEKHAEQLSFPQTIPFVDRMDYLAAMNSELAFAMAVERLCGLEETIPRRVHYVRVLVAELNRIASHLLGIGTYGIDLGAITAFLWCLRDREHILNLFEWASGARLLYNYIWIGGLYYDIPPGFEERAGEFVEHFLPHLDELERLLTENPIFLERTAGVGPLPLEVAINYGVTGPMLRASGLRYDLRRVDGYGVYPELDFEVPIGEGKMGQLGDCWDRYWVRVQEMRESCRIIRQCLAVLQGPEKRTPLFDPREAIPKKARPVLDEVYVRAENPRGSLGYYLIGQPKKEVPFRCKARGPSFCNLSVLPALSRGVLVADLVAILGSIDIVLCEVDR